MKLKESFNELIRLLMEDLEGLERFGIALLFSMVILLFFLYLSKWIRKLVTNRLRKRLENSLLTDFVGETVRGLILIFGLTLLLRFLGLTGVVSGILAGAGITAFIIGFALKDIGENFLAGILLAFKRSYKTGDVVDINGIRGTVRALNLRDTHIKTGDGKDVFVPNASIIKSPLTNFTLDGFLSYNFTVGLDYGSDYARAIKIIEEVIAKVPGVLTTTKKTSVNISEMAASTLNVTVTYWVNTRNSSQPDAKVRSNAILAVLTALEKAGFNLPGNIVEMKNYRDEANKWKLENKD